ncbi:MAG: ABC transporter permease [Clostridia bacterium]|nr:ABC transporter permease [Clostridia bacterium]
MKPFINALYSDMLFQYHQGFYGIYGGIVILYILLLKVLPKTMTAYVLPLVIFTDPSVLGLFFIGGILLLEKEQGVIALLRVTPLRLEAYLMSKIISLTAIGLLVSLVLALAIQVKVNILLLVIGVVITSVFFTLFGIRIGSASTSINVFFIKMMPMMIASMLPCLLLYTSYDYWLLNIIPGVACFRLIYGAYHGLAFLEGMGCIIWSVTAIYMLWHHVKIGFPSRMIYGE